MGTLLTMNRTRLQSFPVAVPATTQTSLMETHLQFWRRQFEVRKQLQPFLCCAPFLLAFAFVLTVPAVDSSCAARASFVTPGSEQALWGRTNGDFDAPDCGCESLTGRPNDEPSDQLPLSDPRNPRLWLNAPLYAANQNQGMGGMATGFGGVSFGLMPALLSTPRQLLSPPLFLWLLKNGQFSVPAELFTRIFHPPRHV